ncbi:MAG: ion transporter [Bacteroidales bacterium]|nr:ion transporter [Bacteroidales bacterium]
MKYIKLSYWEHLFYMLVDDCDENNRFSRAFRKFMLVLIILSVGEMALETDDDIFIPYKVYFIWFDMFSVWFFSLDYFARIFTAHLCDPDYENHHNRWKSVKKYIFSFYGLVDLLSILPYWLTFTKIDLRVMRLLRLLRFLRVFKIARYNNSIDLIASVFKEKKSDLGVTCGLILIVMILASFMMYYAEHDAQPEAFPNVLGCIWWAIVTLTTIGYGDVYPITAFGKIIGGVIAFLGVGLVAMPTGIISAGFLEKINKDKELEEVEANKSDIVKNREEIEKLKQMLAEREQELQEHKAFCPYCGHKLD